MNTEELIDEYERMGSIDQEPMTPKSAARVKRRREKEEGPFIYSVSAAIRSEISPTNITPRWNNKIGSGLWENGKFNIDELGKEIFKALET